MLSTPVTNDCLPVFFPRVSIVIPVYNGSNYLNEAIGSALRQTYKNKEVIVVNDGSDDGGKTAEIAESYGDKIRYFGKANGGVASALNCGIRNMEGGYLSWLSHDDLYLPFKLERQVRLLSQLENKDVVLYSDFEIIDALGNRLGQIAIESKITMKPLRAILSTSIHGCSTLISKRLLDRVGTFNEDLKTTQDNEMWLRIYRKGFPFVHSSEVLIKSRVHKAQGQRKMANINRIETEKFYSWALRECRESIQDDFRGVLEALRTSNVDLPLSVFRDAGFSNDRLCSLHFLQYKALFVSRRARKYVRILLSSQES